MRWRDRGCVAAVLAGSLVFAVPTGSSVAVSTVSSGEAAVLRPSDLIGTWWPIAEGAPDGTKVRFDGGQWVAYKDNCNTTGWIGSWEAIPSGQFVADVWAWSDCYVGMSNWMDTAVAFRPNGADMELLDADGRVAVTLKPAKPDRSPGAHGAQPVVSQAQRDELDAPPADPPVGLLPASPELFVGRWVPTLVATEQRPDHTYVDVAADGTWLGRDQCSGTTGRWVLGAEGRLLTTASGWNLVACRAIPASHWMARAAWAGFLGSVLVLVDKDGDVLGHLLPAPQQPLV